MNWIALLVGVATVSAVALLVIEARELRLAYAPLRVRAAGIGRIAVAYALALLSVWVVSMPGRPSVASVPLAIGLLLAIAIPDRWIHRIGLGDPWQIHRIYAAAARLSGNGPNPPAPQAIAELRDRRSQLLSLSTPRSAEWIGLMVAEIDDWIASRYVLIPGALRVIRMHELDVELLGDRAPVAGRSASEATLLWQLFRTFADLLDISAEPLDGQAEAAFRDQLTELDAYRRPATNAFIEQVQASGRSWLDHGPARGQWIDDSGITGLGPDIDAEYWKIWPNLRVLWGAELDDDDRAESTTLAASPASAERSLGREGPIC
jgi:hypothetical protein